MTGAVPAAYTPPPVRTLAESSPDSITSENELQARWFAGDFGRDLVSLDGEKIRIVSFGVWNFEAGPDFIEAVISINEGEPVKGALEIDMEDRDWERHGHAVNPDFESVVLHLFLRRSRATAFTRTADNRRIPQVLLNPAECRQFTLEQPPAVIPGRCQGPLKHLQPAAVENLLKSAALHRLQIKSAQISAWRQLHGDDEALFQNLARSLGYKENQLPFLLLAQRLPLKKLRADGKEAVLFGCGGFLPSHGLEQLPTDSRDYVKTLWAEWWSRRHTFPRFEQHPVPWRFKGLRPANHPQRRLAALAALVGRWSLIRKTVEGAPVASIPATLQKLSHPFWDHHHTLHSARAPRPMALIGKSRSLEMLANVILPWRMSCGELSLDDYWRLPAAGGNRRLSTAAARLFESPDTAKAHSRKLYQEQGLLQIYQDYCMRDLTDCRHCPFPETLGLDRVIS